MRSRPLARLLTSATAALALLSLPLVGSPAGAADLPTAARAAKPAVKVMTRNLYLGANIMRPINAAQGVPAEPAETYPIRLVDALANATDTTRAIVDETDFATRARLLASELVEHRPDLVGLQEVAMWRSGPMDDPTGTDFLVPNATTVDVNFLKLLRQQLKAQGVPTERSASTGCPTWRRRRSRGRSSTRRASATRATSG